MGTGARQGESAKAKNQPRVAQAVPRSRALVLAVAAVTVAVPGCFSEILPQAPVSTLAFACAAIDPATAARLRIVTYVEDGVGLPVGAAIGALAQQLVNLSGRDPSSVAEASLPAPDEPKAGWNESRLAAWVRDEPFVGRGQVTLRVLWLRSFGDGEQAGLVPAPGAVVLSARAIEAGAQRMGRPVGEVTVAVLLHFTGHALGATNRGIPVQDPDIQEREGPAGHDADPASVLAVGWEDARTMAWAANATYGRYPDAALADWQAAREESGVCGVRR